LNRSRKKIDASATPTATMATDFITQSMDRLTMSKLIKRISLSVFGKFLDAL
jgi:hypothetical protein